MSEDNRGGGPSEFSVEGHDVSQVVGIDGKVISSTAEITIERKPNAAPDDTVWGVVEQILALDPKDPKYKLKLSAKIKRLVHHEKHGLMSRIFIYGGEGKDPSLYKFVMDDIELRIKNHEEWAAKPDEEIVTWKV